MELKSTDLTTVLVCTSNKGKMREFAAAWIPEHRIMGLADLGAEQRRRYGEPCEDGDSFVHNGLIKLSAAMDALCDADSGGRPDIILVDDSGLVVPALDHRPGVHSATYAGVPRDDGRNRARLAAEVRQYQGAVVRESGERRLDAYFVAALLACDWRGVPVAERVAQAARCREALAHLTAKPTVHFPSLFPALSWEQGVFRACERDGLGACVPHEAVVGHLVPDVTMTMSYGFCRGTVSDTEQQLLEGEGHGYDALFFPREFPQLSFASIPLADKNRLSHRGRALGALLRSLSRPH